MPTIYQIIIVTLLSAFIILFSNKTELRYKLRNACDLYGIWLIAKMLDCDFCFSFWLSLLISIIISAITQDISWIATAILSPPIIRILI